MKRISIIASVLSLLTLSSIDDARADVVSDRVLLMTGSSTCGKDATGFRRIKQMPDGSQTVETVEFQPPAGTYLEITNIEYTTPYFTPWAKFYVQSLDVSIRQRYGTASTSVLSAKYQNRSVYAEDASDNYVEIGEVGSPGAQTNVVAFPVGPLMSTNGRLCVATSNNFWVYGGAVRVRGRLIPSGELVIEPPPGEIAKVQ